VRRRPISFPAEGGTVLAGDLLLPDGEGPFGCVIFTQALSQVQGGSTWNQAEALVEAGVAALIYTIRGYEESVGGAPFDQDIEREIRDHRHCITFAGDQPDIDVGRIGFFGTSVRGGEAIVLAAIDRRLACVVAQVPMMSGRETSKRRLRPDALAQRHREFAADRLAVLHGEPPATLRTVPENEDDDRPAFLASTDFIAYCQQTAALGVATPEYYTLRSQEFLFAFEPRAYLPLVSPTPMLMLVAQDDKEVGTADQLLGYADALEPKRVVITRGGHFDVHAGEPFRQTCAAVTEWCVQWLGQPA
jgi:hypothetical protein